jgi:hypothetical protein
METGTELKKHSAELERCNQRGGRMLSLADLLMAGTLPLEVAAFLLERVSKGASFIVGAKPGGAGKTTVMCALANAIPEGMKIFHAENIGSMLKAEALKPACFICHEIGSGSYYAYLWGEELRVFFGLKKYGHVLASNLHADTYEQAKAQVVKQNGVAETDFLKVNLYLFLSVKGFERRTNTVWYSKNGEPHKRIYEGGEFSVEGIAKEKELKKSADLLAGCVNKGILTVEDFRKNLYGAGGA